MHGWHTMPYTFLRGAARAFELASSALTHLAAGTLRLQDLRGAIVNAWEEFGRSEELIRSGLMPWERALYDRFLKVKDRILVVGCGTGRDLIALLKLGYRVEGLDVGPRAIAWLVASSKRKVSRQSSTRARSRPSRFRGALTCLPSPGSATVTSRRRTPASACSARSRLT